MSTCEWATPKCMNPATSTSTVKVDQYTFMASVCDEHRHTVQTQLLSMGYEPLPLIARNGRNLITYITDSGQVYTSKDVRTWAINAGKLEERTTGRVTDQLIEEYGASH